MIRRFLVAGAVALFLFSSPGLAQVSPESAEKYIAGQELFQKRRYAEAIKIFDEAVTIDGKNAQAYQAMGLTYQKMRDYEKAADAYKMATSVKPDYTAAYFALGQLQFVSLKKYVDAQASFKKVLQMESGFRNGKAREFLAVAHLRQGHSYIRQKNYKQAVAEYTAASQIDPSSAKTFYNLGLAHKGARNYSEAIAAVSTATDLDPGYDKAHKALGDLYKVTRKNSRAAAAYEKALKANPKNVKAYIELSDVYADTRQLTKAVSTLKRGVTNVPDDANMLTALGFAQHQSKDFTAAIASYKKALVKKPGSKETNYRISVSYFETQQYKSAAAAARKALSGNFLVPANVILGDIYEATKSEGWKDTAITHYQKGLRHRRYKKYCEDKIDRIKNPMGEDEAG
jgi:tetratricopeptide (TPR) repeat protein